jgi:2,4-dienoyl-CoA reductase (NADPH2)
VTTSDPVLAATLEQWHHCVATRDMSTLREILHPDAVFRSPVAHTPYPGADVVTLILGTVVQVFEDFTYHRTLVSDDSRSAVLEFSARVGDRIDDDGRIVDFEVMIRPLSGLQALAAEMGSRLAAYL